MTTKNENKVEKMGVLTIKKQSTNESSMLQKCIIGELQKKKVIRTMQRSKHEEHNFNKTLIGLEEVVLTKFASMKDRTRWQQIARNHTDKNCPKLSIEYI